MFNPIWRGRFAIGDELIPLRRHEPIVALIHAALIARSSTRETVRRAIHLLRK